MKDAGLPFNGMCVIESAYLEEDGEPYTVRRSWRERLFSRPWRPFVATRTVVPKVPYRGAMRIGPNTLLMHPATLRAMCDRLATGDDLR